MAATAISGIVTLMHMAATASYLFALHKYMAATAIPPLALIKLASSTPRGMTASSTTSLRGAAMAHFASNLAAMAIPTLALVKLTATTPGQLSEMRKILGAMTRRSATLATLPVATSTNPDATTGPLLIMDETAAMTDCHLM